MVSLVAGDVDASAPTASGACPSHREAGRRRNDGSSVKRLMALESEQPIGWYCHADRSGERIAQATGMALHLAARSGLSIGTGTQVIPRPSKGHVSGPEDLFSALDGRELKVLGCHWRIEVFSVCQLGGCRYVQLALQGERPYMLTLRVSAGAELRLLIPRLLTWLAHPSSSGEIVEVG